MQTTEIRCKKDPRPDGAGVSDRMRLWLFGQQQRGLRFELHPEGVLVRPGRLLDDDARLVMRHRFHEVRELLLEEEKSPQ